MQNESDSIFNEFASDDEKKLSTDKEVNTSYVDKNSDPVITKKEIKKAKVDDVASPTRSTPKKAKEKVQPPAPVKGLFIVDPDSLSYF
jgi:hypothetical protein